MKELKDYPELMTPREVSQYLRINYQLVLGMIKKGDLPSITLGGRNRVVRDELSKMANGVERETNFVSEMEA